MHREPIDPQRLGRRAKARKHAAEIIDVAEAVVTDPGSGADGETFWRALAEEAAARVGLVLIEDGPTARPMTDQEAKRFELEPIPYGRYKGHDVGDVARADDSYLDLLINSQFQRELRRFMASPYYRKPRGLGY